MYYSLIHDNKWHKPVCSGISNAFPSLLRRCIWRPSVCPANVSSLKSFFIYPFTKPGYRSLLLVLKTVCGYICHWTWPVSKIIFLGTCCLLTSSLILSSFLCLVLLYCLFFSFILPVINQFRIESHLLSCINSTTQEKGVAYPLL